MYTFLNRGLIAAVTRNMERLVIPGKSQTHLTSRHVSKQKKADIRTVTYLATKAPEKVESMLCLGRKVSTHPILSQAFQ